MKKVVVKDIGKWVFWSEESPNENGDYDMFFSPHKITFDDLVFANKNGWSDPDWKVFTRRISITPDILAKNGFRETTGGIKNLLWYLKTDDVLIEMREVTPNVYETIVHKDVSDLGDSRVFIRFIDQLQTVFELCGIDKDIDLNNVDYSNMLIL